MKIFEKSLTLLLALAVAVSLYSMGIKAFTEANNREFEIGMSYNEIETLARMTQKDPREIILTFKDAGLSSLIIEDTTLRDEVNWGRALILNGWQLLDHERFLGIEDGPLKEVINSKDFSPKSYYVLTKDEKVFEDLAEFLPGRGFDIKTYSNDIYVVQEVRGEGFFSDISLGIGNNAFERSEEFGLNTIVYLRDLSKKTPDEIKKLAETFTKRNISALIPQDNKLPNDKEAVGILLESLGDDILLGFDEFAGNGDMDAAIRQRGYSAVRVYNRPAHRIMEEYLLAVRDRNDRILLLHPFLTGQEDLVAYNARHISEICNIIISGSPYQRLKPGSIKPFKSYAYGSGMSFLAALGSLWALWRIALVAGFGKKAAFALTSAITALLTALFIKDFNIFRDAAGLLAAVSFPVLGIYGEMKKSEEEIHLGFKQILKSSATSFSRVILIAAAGAAILGGIYGGIDALIGITKFRGIKALYIAAYALIVLLYILDMEGGVSLRKPVLSLGGIAAILALSGALFILITRSGNESVIPIPKWELAFRTWLENAFWVRPRTKEFLLGFPALMLAGGLKTTGYHSIANWSYMAALSGVLSMVNTFSHFHIVTVISLIRSVEGIVLGMAIGAAALGGIYLYEKREKVGV